VTDQSRPITIACTDPLRANFTPSHAANACRARGSVPNSDRVSTPYFFRGLTLMFFRFTLALALSLVGLTPVRAGDVMAGAAARGDLVAAAVPDQLPLAATDASGQLQGFDIEVARALASRLGLPVRFVTPGWDAILSGDWQGRWDFSVSSITPTDARAQRLDFPATYRFDAAVVVVRRGEETIMTPANASGRSVGVKENTTFEQYLRRDLRLPGLDSPNYQIDDAKILRFPDKADALKALAKGEVDAAVTSLATAQAAINDGLALRVLPGFLFFEPVAVAVDKSDPEFSRMVEEAVLAMSGDGTLGQLSIKWFGIDMTQLAPVGAPAAR
jgi:polar amino acid transport system substrate-binding protein